MLLLCLFLRKERGVQHGGSHPLRASWEEAPLVGAIHLGEVCVFVFVVVFVIVFVFVFASTLNSLRRGACSRCCPPWWGHICLLLSSTRPTNCTHHSCAVYTPIPPLFKDKQTGNNVVFLYAFIHQHQQENWSCFFGGKCCFCQSSAAQQHDSHRDTTSCRMIWRVVENCPKSSDPATIRGHKLTIGCQ